MPSDDHLKSNAKATNAYPAWCPRFWHGMRVGTWWKLLARNRFRVTLTRWPLAFSVSFFTPLNDIMGAAQWLLFDRRIRSTPIDRDPLFILGHWRSGTTLLHELLVTDPQFASPNTYQCFAPWHFLLSEPLMLTFGNFLLPKKRPMDEMEAGWTLPQEDEFALMNLGVPTTYLRIAFPHTQDNALETLDMRGLQPAQLAKWSEKLRWYIQVLTYHYDQKQLVLKSPPHTGRVSELVRLFPKAKFIHLTRDPRKLFLSTMRLWQSLDEVQALQRPTDEEELKQFVYECMRRMYRGFEAGRSLVPTEQIVDVRYEDLVADPLGTLRGLYQKLDLGDFDQMEPLLTERLSHHKEYRPNQHAMDADLEQEIMSNWSEYAHRYGYV